MAILFDFYRSPSTGKNGEAEKERFHARVACSQVLNINEMVQHISQRSTLSKSDILAVISELSDEIADGLLKGYQVNLPDIGTFSLSLKAPKEADPQKTHAQSIGVKRIEYRADHRLKQRVASQAVFERSRQKVHSAAINIYEMDALLIDYFEEHTFITRKGLEDLCHLTRSTATRHLKRLVREGRLINTNTSRNPAYEPAKGYYNR